MSNTTKDPTIHEPKEVTEIRKLAFTAMEKQDCEELYKLFGVALEERAKAIELVAMVGSHYVGDARSPRFQPDANAIKSLEKIATEALELAKMVIHSGVKK